jgi:hypothetical protein
MRKKSDYQRENSRAATRKIRESLFDHHRHAEAGGFGMVTHFFRMAIIEANRLAGKATCSRCLRRIRLRERRRPRVTFRQATNNDRRMRANSISAIIDDADACAPPACSKLAFPGSKSPDCLYVND